MTEVQKEQFDLDKLITALEKDDAEQIALQSKLTPIYYGQEWVTFESTLGEALLNSDYKLAERMANFLIDHHKVVEQVYGRKRTKYDGAEDLPFWGQFILYGMTNRYYNRWETTPFFKGLSKLVTERVFDPWQCINSAETFIKMIRLGLGRHEHLKFTDKGESLTYYVIMTNKTSIQNKLHILRFIKWNNLLDLSAHNGLPSPAIAAITHRYRSIWNKLLCRFDEVRSIHDEQGNNMLYYVFKHKVNFNHMVEGQRINNLVDMLCEKNKEGKAMIEYSIEDNKYLHEFFKRRYRHNDKVAYLMFQKLAQNNELELLQRLPPIPSEYNDRFAFLYAQFNFPHNKAEDVKQTHARTKRKKFQEGTKFVDGSNTTFSLEQLPAEIFEIILTDLDPIDIMCLKLSSKVLEAAFNRTKFLTNYFPRSLDMTTDSPSTEFNRRVKLDVNWKKHKYRETQVKNIPHYLFNAAMDEHWFYTGGARHMWLTNLHTHQRIEVQCRGVNNCQPLLLESAPDKIPLVAALFDGHFRLLKFAADGELSVYGAKHLNALFTYSPQTKQHVPTYIRQLKDTDLVMGQEGTIWNYNVDATLGHLIDQTMLAETSVHDVHANESLIVVATTTGLSLYDHKTFNNIATFGENYIVTVNDLPRHVYIHNNEVVHFDHSGIHYYDVRTHRLFDTVPFINKHDFGQPVKHVFDLSGTRYVQSYNDGDFLWNIIYNIRERGWESVLLACGHRNFDAINSYAMLMDKATLFLFD